MVAKRGFPRVLLLGCGYVGKEFLRQIEEKKNKKKWVLPWTMSQEAALSIEKEKKIKCLWGDAVEKKNWEQVPSSIDIIICGLSSRRSPEIEVYRKTYKQVLDVALEKFPQARIIFLSSTSVYEQIDGSWVTENSLAEPQSPRGKILKEAEKITLEAKGCVLRLSGIYGPGRSFLLERYLRGESKIEGDGNRWMNQVHRDDAASALLHVLFSAHLKNTIYNVCDNFPVREKDYFFWLSRKFKKNIPTYSKKIFHRKRVKTNKRVSNQKLFYEGWSPRYKNFKRGISSFIC